MQDLEKLKAEYNELLNQLSDPELISDWEKFEELSKRKTSLEKIIEKDKELKDLEKRIEENNTILKSHEDQELSSLAETEISQLEGKKKNLEEELKKLLQNDNKEDIPNAVLVEIRAGTGGDEAALFAADLFKMYSKYALAKNWSQKVLDSNLTDVGGYKEITFELKGPDVFQKMISEAGVHRVQRIPTTEKAGRIHTSTASVAVLPIPKKTEIKMNLADLRIDYFRSSGPGGQNVNKRMTAVRITHLPTGIVVASQTQRNQLQNKDNAMSILAAKLLEKKESEAVEKLGGNRNSQIGSAKRAEKIRTYNFPQDRVTDHRIKKTFHNIEGIMNGKLDPLTENLKEET